MILEDSVFDNFILADEPFAKPLCILETCVSGNNNIFGKLALSLPHLMNVLKLIGYHFIFLILTY